MSLIDHMSAELEDYSQAPSDLLYNRFLLRYFIPMIAQDRHSDLQLQDQQKILDILKGSISSLGPSLQRPGCGRCDEVGV